MKPMIPLGSLDLLLVRSLGWRARLEGAVLVILDVDDEEYKQAAQMRLADRYAEYGRRFETHADVASFLGMSEADFLKASTQLDLRDHGFEEMV